VIPWAGSQRKEGQKGGIKLHEVRKKSLGVKNHGERKAGYQKMQQKKRKPGKSCGRRRSTVTQNFVGGCRSESENKK